MKRLLCIRSTVMSATNFQQYTPKNTKLLFCICFFVAKTQGHKISPNKLMHPVAMMCLNHFKWAWKNDFRWKMNWFFFGFVVRKRWKMILVRIYCYHGCIRSVDYVLCITHRHWATDGRLKQNHTLNPSTAAAASAVQKKQFSLFTFHLYISHAPVHLVRYTFLKIISEMTFWLTW